jgi:S1-C subfamily serine protease
MLELAAGQRISLNEPVIEVGFEGPHLDRLSGEAGAALIGLDSARQIPASFPMLNAGGREMRPGASFGANGELRLDLSALPADVDRLVLVLYIMRGIGSGITFRDFGSIALTLAGHRFNLDLRDRGDAALILVEIYRRGDGWRCSANGQGFVGGLGALASAMGIHIEVPRAERPPGAGPGPGSSGRGGDYGDSRSGASFSGSGFAIDRRHILTNAHVIEGARQIRISGEAFTVDAEVVLTDPRNDIALLRVDRDLGDTARLRDTFDIHLGEDVVVVGFPLQGLLGSGPTVTAGNISALCGIGNDTSVLQFSAPIASGNSGGPILDQSGLVIGLVHATLNKEHIREHGSSAENINFGVKGVTVRSFLATAGIVPRIADAGASRGRADIVREARGYVYRIKCEGL